MILSKITGCKTNIDDNLMQEFLRNSGKNNTLRLFKKNELNIISILVTS